jgi:DNA-3-methyladenine glycosylase II
MCYEQQGIRNGEICMSGPISSDDDIAFHLEQLLEIDPRLASVAEIAGNLPLRLQPPGFAGLARIIISQHVSTASAAAIYSRFLDEISPVSPRRFFDAGQETWIRIGLTRAKQATLKLLAGEMLAGRLDLDELGKLPPQEALAQLTKLKGIGPWTAEVYLLLSAGHPDIFAAGDLAIREAVRDAFGMDTRPSEPELRKIALLWTPHRGVATRLFWTYYEKRKQLKQAVV